MLYIPSCNIGNSVCMFHFLLGHSNVGFCHTICVLYIVGDLNRMTVVAIYDTDA